MSIAQRRLRGAERSFPRMAGLRHETRAYGGAPDRPRPGRIDHDGGYRRISSLAEFEAKFRYFDLADFMAEHHITTVDELKRAYRYLLGEVKLAASPAFDPADPSNQRRFELDLAILIRDGIDIAGCLRDAAAWFSRSWRKGRFLTGERSVRRRSRHLWPRSCCYRETPSPRPASPRRSWRPSSRRRTCWRSPSALDGPVHRPLTSAHRKEAKPCRRRAQRAAATAAPKPIPTGPRHPRNSPPRRLRRTAGSNEESSAPRRRQMSAAEQAALRRKLRDKFH